MSLIEQLGQKIDDQLATLGLTLTQGGEPTYVPRRTDKPEWNTEALGPEKLLYARRLGHALIQSMFPGAVAMRLQGKLYPGETLPRWALALFRRNNGAPVWKNPERLLWDQRPMRLPTEDTPRQLLESIARSLGLDNSPQPLFEDVLAWLWREHPTRAAELRISVLRSENRLSPIEALDCEALSGWETICKPAGWVLPLDFNGKRWLGEEWLIPGESEIGLVAGDSAAGLRLPLHRLPAKSLRRAITAEIRNKELTLFLPPCTSFPAFCELVEKIETVISEHRLPPVAIEGYPPPIDPEWECLSMTSDPGVLEVNLPAAASFQQLTHHLTTLHSAATRIGLTGRKLTFNGRRVGTGGGAHILFGGPTLADNPFVKRPHLLASLLRFLVAHPALSYVFSGLYLGPSCQAPRPDETIAGMVDELEIALTALESLPAPADPAFIDRLLRSLLLDWNGNTHRAEVCVDKFCNPYASNGRLGVVELRAIEMFPDVESNLTVNLLFRALLAIFLETPFDEPLVRWTTKQREAFLLPEAARDDLNDVLAFLAKREVNIPANQFEPILDFRFPLLHAWRGDGISFELRQALDFWCAMGDSGGGTSRRVDASTDRLQFSLVGPGAEDYDVVINGWRANMQSSSRDQRFGGVRYQAFTNDYGLHPHLKPHTPLTIEVVERETGVSKYACEYSPWKLDGGYYPGLPKDDEDARARVTERSRELSGRIGKPFNIRELPEFLKDCHTLDLRVAWADTDDTKSK